MIQLGMPYRFAHFWRDGNGEEEVARVMQALNPSSSDWWAQNYVYICYFGYGMTYTSVDTQFRSNWPILRAVYKIISSHISTNRLVMECSDATEKLSENLYTLFRSNEMNSLDVLNTIDSSAAVSYSSLEAKVIAQLESVDLFSPVSCQDDYPMLIRSGLKCFLSALLEFWTTWTMKRWKLREPLEYRVDIGAEKWYDYGHQTWCRDPLRIEFRKIFSKSFWCDKDVKD